MTLYIEPRSMISRPALLLIAEKGIEPDIVFVDENKPLQRVITH